MLLSIAKLQNLKAIHNGNAIQTDFDKVVINRKTTKFESNSQYNIHGYTAFAFKSSVEGI